MRVGPYEISFKKAVPRMLQSVESRGGWYPLIRESFSGAWQSNVEITISTVLTHPIVYACISLIASDIAKLGGPRLVREDANGIWTPVDNPAFSPFLRQPNRYQNPIQFFESWMISKLAHGNTYTLRARDERGITVQGYILDPTRVRVLVAPDGSVYYELKEDNLSSLQSDVTVPASEIIHDRMNTFYHPLVGIPPITACGLAATMGVNILSSSSSLFATSANPGGVLTAPGPISQETADRVKAYWQSEYSGDNVGKIAMLGDGLKFEPMMMKAVDSQLTEQGDWVSKLICSAFHVPAYMVGVGPAPLNNNVEALQQEYYSRCLQIHAESIEKLLDAELPKPYGTEFDLDILLRMDTATMVKSIADGVGAGVLSPNEGRLKLNLGPVKGGDSPYLQQQQFSLEALAERDADKPFSKPEAPTPATAAEPTVSDDEIAKELDMLFRKELEMA
jgi:HK97 family phage portal protein